MTIDQVVNVVHYMDRQTWSSLFLPTTAVGTQKAFILSWKLLVYVEIDPVPPCRCVVKGRRHGLRSKRALGEITRGVHLGWMDVSCPVVAS